jgi:arylsulfatase A-like enzyme
VVAPFSRRTFLRGTAAGGVALAWTAGGVWARPAAADDGPVRVYQIVVDGLRVDEVDRMPTLARLAAEGTYYPQARAHMVAETTTNHLSMLTGMYAHRHGMPGNSVPRLSQRVSDDRRYTKADSILTIARRQAPDLVTATVGSKTYVAELAKHDRSGDGEQDATRTNTPVTAVPVVDAAFDEETGTEAWLISRELDPDFLFLNLGMTDRAGHVDETGA